MDEFVDVVGARRFLAARLAAAGVPSPEADALQLLEAALGVNRADLLLRPHTTVSRTVGSRLAEMLRRREAREPLQLIVGHAHFYGLELAVAPGVLIPRPETERLVELVLAELRASPPAAPPVVLDVGCGTGAIGLALKAELPGAEVWGSDSSAAAVTLARANAATLELEVRSRTSDLFDDPDVAAVAARCQALVSNPPYLPDSDRGHLSPEVEADPASALFAGHDGLAVARRLVTQAERLLPNGALLALELDPRNVHELADELMGAREQAASARAWRAVRVEDDLTGRARFLLARRVVEAPHGG